MNAPPVIFGPTRRFIVTLTPAIRLANGGHRAVIVPNVPDPVFVVEARNVAELEIAVIQVAAMAGMTCTASIRSALGGRQGKPKGFRDFAAHFSRRLLEFDDGGGLK